MRRSEQRLSTTPQRRLPDSWSLARSSRHRRSRPCPPRPPTCGHRPRSTSIHGCRECPSALTRDGQRTSTRNRYVRKEHAMDSDARFSLRLIGAKRHNTTASQCDWTTTHRDVWLAVRSSITRAVFLSVALGGLLGNAPRAQEGVL